MNKIDQFMGRHRNAIKATNFGSLLLWILIAIFTGGLGILLYAIVMIVCCGWTAFVWEPEERE